MITDTVEFEKIHEAYRAKIFRYLTGLVGEQEAEDLTQDVFIKVGQALKTFRGEAQLSTWIYRIATNAAIDKTRSSSFRQTTRQSSFDRLGRDRGQDRWHGGRITSHRAATLAAAKIRLFHGLCSKSSAKLSDSHCAQ